MVLTNVNKFAVVGFGIFVLGEARSWQARPRWSEKAPVFCDSSRRAPPRLAALEALGALEAALRAAYSSRRAPGRRGPLVQSREP